MLIVANVLDPRCKLDFVIWCFSSLYDTRKVDELRANIKELLLKLFESYGGESNLKRCERCRVVYDGASSSFGSSDATPHWSQVQSIWMCLRPISPFVFNRSWSANHIKVYTPGGPFHFQAMFHLEFSIPVSFSVTTIWVDLTEKSPY